MGHLYLTNYLRLSKTRRKRAVPEDWATRETVQSFIPLQSTKSTYGGSRSVALDDSGELALFGSSDGTAGVFAIQQNKLVQEFPVDGSVTDALWAGSKAVLGTSTGTVNIFENGVEVSSFTGHAGEVAALALHPSGEILASVGVDKSYIFYDLTSSVQTLQVSTDSGKTIFYMLSASSTFADIHSVLTTARFHPDGHLFAAGGLDGQIKVFDVTSGANAANFDESGPLQALSFSENGTWLAAVARGSTSVSIWDLRKSAQIKIIDTGGQVTAAIWDYTGQFLATAGPSGITVQQYSKATKEWSEPLRSAEPARAVAWGSNAQRLVALSESRLTILGPK